MKIKDLQIGTIFTVPSNPQWGIMMVSLLREEKKKVYVSLTGNCWTHNHNPMLDDDIEVEIRHEVKELLDHVKRSVIIKHYSS